jgi:hypothetical protein
VVASTADGRVAGAGLAGQGKVRATLRQGTLMELQLSLSTDLPCASTTDTLAYTNVSCATTREVSGRLIVDRYLPNPAANSVGLELDVYDRQGNPTGAPDRVDTFQFVP